MIATAPIITGRDRAYPVQGKAAVLEVGTLAEPVTVKVRAYALQNGGLATTRLPATRMGQVPGSA